MEAASLIVLLLVSMVFLALLVAVALRVFDLPGVRFSWPSLKSSGGPMTWRSFAFWRRRRQPLPVREVSAAALAACTLSVSMQLRCCGFGDRL